MQERGRVSAAAGRRARSMVHELDFVCVRIRPAGFSSVSCSRHFISESLVRSMIAKIRNGQMADRQLLRK